MQLILSFLQDLQTAACTEPGAPFSYWPRIRAHSSCPAQLQDTPRAAQEEGTEGSDRNKAKSQSPRGALPPELRDPPDGTALPWTWPSGWVLEQSRADASWHHQIWYWHSGNTQPWHWSFLVSAISDINLSPYSKFKAKDKTKCKSALCASKHQLNSDRGCTNRIPHSSKESYTLLPGSAGKHFTWVFCLSDCCHTLKSLLLVVNEVHPLQTQQAPTA